MTIACGLAQSFVHLMFARIGLAMAEAGLPPAALTLLADVHDRPGLARATSLFMLAPFVGGGFALFVGGPLYASLDAAALPLGLEAWQALFVLAGVPGLLLAPLVAGLIADPRGRRVAAVAADEPCASLGAYLLAERRFCLPYMLALALTVTVLNAHIAWIPTAILRRFDVGAAGMGASFGLVYLVAGASGTLAAGWNLARAEEGGMLRRTLTQMQVAALLLVPSALAAPLAPGLGATLLLAGVAVFCTSAIVSMGSLPFQLAAPPELRARLIALAGLFAALIGTGLGPLFVGLASDGFAGAGVAEPLPLALSVVGGAAALLVALLLVAARRATRRLPQRNHQRASSERPILERR
jgi:hypothetical protein